MVYSVQVSMYVQPDKANEIMNDKQLMQWMLLVDIAILVALVIDVHFTYLNYQASHGGK